jgi:glycosyltransferase involved in cell wall biosynthesis
VSRIVVVSSFPPRHCGIGAYAAAQVDRWRAEGHDVLVISPPDGRGDVRVPFEGGRPFREAARLGRAADRIVVHFQPALYFKPRAPLSKVATAWALWSLVRRRPRTEIVIHEADRPVRWRPDYAMLARAFRAAPVLDFHTERERQALERAYRIRVRARIVPHAEGIAVHGPTSRSAARARLGISPDRKVLVCPGFWHPDKGIERAIEGFRHSMGDLYVVGSVKDPTPANMVYADRLRGLAHTHPGVTLVESYVSDEDFDAWVAAADAVVLPYRRSWSSGALARAQAIGTPAIVSDVGGLAEQAGERDTLVSTDQELARAMAEAGRAEVPR